MSKLGGGGKVIWTKSKRTAIFCRETFPKPALVLSSRLEWLLVVIAFLSFVHICCQCQLHVDLALPPGKDFRLSQKGFAYQCCTVSTCSTQCLVAEPPPCVTSSKTLYTGFLIERPPAIPRRRPATRVVSFRKSPRWFDPSLARPTRPTCWRRRTIRPRLSC